jgi:hypothetical protein
MFSPNLLGDNKILGGWLEFTGLSKAAKTVLNPLESITPQIYGNIARCVFLEGQPALHLRSNPKANIRVCWKNREVTVG